MSGSDKMHLIHDEWGRAHNIDICSETEPTTTWPYMLWLKVSTATLKVRNLTNSAWVTVGTGGGGGAPIDAQYLLMAPNAELTNERILAVGKGLDLADGGAGGAATLTVDADDLDGDGLQESGGDLAVDATVVRTTGAQSIAGEKTFTDPLLPESISRQMFPVGVGCPYDTLGEAIAAVNAAGPPALGSEYTIRLLAGTTTEAGDITIPSYCTVGGVGQNTIIDMGANTLYMSDNAALADVVVRGAGGSDIMKANNADCTLQNVIVTGTGVDAIDVSGNSAVLFYNVQIIPTGALTYGFHFFNTSSGTLWFCRARDETNLTGAFRDESTGTIFTIFCSFRAVGLDAYTGAGADWQPFMCEIDPANVVLSVPEQVLPTYSVWVGGKQIGFIWDADKDTYEGASTDDELVTVVGGSTVLTRKTDGLYLGISKIIDMDEQATPASPAAGRRKIYPKADGWYDLDSAGAETGPFGAGGGDTDYVTFVVKNTSGGAVSTGDVGYIDSAGEFKTTTTAYLDTAWCVVMTGGADNADIYVARRGRVTVTLNGNCSAGDFLFTSTTAGRAQPQSYMRAEMFAVALTANAAGAGGTCSALLYCHTKPVSKFASAYVWVLGLPTLMPSSDFRTTINGAPAGAVVTYTVPLTSGAEECIDLRDGNELAKIRLYNENTADYVLIDSVDTALNQITLTAAAPGGWANGHIITARSQTCVHATVPPAFFDFDLSSTDNTVVPVLARSLTVAVTWLDSAVAGQYTALAPFDAYAASSQATVIGQVANVRLVAGLTIPLINRRFCMRWVASGANTCYCYAQLAGWNEASP